MGAGYGEGIIFFTVGEVVCQFGVGEYFFAMGAGFLSGGAEIFLMGGEMEIETVFFASGAWYDGAGIVAIVLEMVEYMFIFYGEGAEYADIG
ncbi:MAG: hypothetical protein Hyperionvirus19_9 [Hyperionvirus sp.]|uniref:Uncharacterized protein n=1 Tax=Hyperionvirus sp. TaxID=2487770 RepID=A0A3G5AAC9_9VIRU|nr:MAG: hypothetical protein Hyperionvirus19_9 [Hyperionvirus sp.]